MNDIEALRQLMAVQYAKDPAELRKTLTAATGFVGYNLEDEAKLLLPMFAGLRSRLPVDTPSMGATQATWRMQLGYGSYSFGANMGTANGGNGADTTPSATTISADYKSQSVKGDVQWEAIQQSKGWDDALAIETSIALSTAIRLDELLCLGGNAAALGAPVPVATSGTLTSPATFATGTWNVTITALTLQGCLTNAAANSNVGETVIGATTVVIAASAKAFIDVTWPAVPGALGYKVYCDGTVGDGAKKLVAVSGLRYAKFSSGAIDLTALGDPIVVPAGQTYVTVNRVQLAAVGTGAAAPGSDGSANANSFEGMVAWATKSTIYSQSLGTRLVKDLGGQSLTTQGTGIAEFDYILNNLWTTWNISPSLILTSPNGVASAGNKIAAINSGAMYRAEIYQEKNKIVGGIYIGGYVNKFAASMMGVQSAIDVWAHPYMADGTFLFLCEQMPPSYRYARTGIAFALDVQTPYTYWELGRTQRSIPFDVFFGETLKCYHPLAQAAIVGARVDA